MSVSVVVGMSVFFLVSSFFTVAVSMVMSARVAGSMKRLISSVENFDLD